MQQALTLIGLFGGGFGEDARELVPLDEEGVVALRRAKLAVLRPNAGRGRLEDERSDLARAIEDVALDPQAGDAHAGVHLHTLEADGADQLERAPAALARVRFLHDGSKSTA